MLSLAATPLVGLVSVAATAAVLVYVGFLLLLREQWRAGEYRLFDGVVGVLMAVISFLTFSLDKAMVVGFSCYAFHQVFIKKEKVNWYLLASFALLLNKRNTSVFSEGPGAGRGLILVYSPDGIGRDGAGPVLQDHARESSLEAF